MWIAKNWACTNHWKPELKHDGTPYPDDELRLTFGSSIKTFRPTIMTIWVHQKYRRMGFGRQLVGAIAQHFNVLVDQIGFRLPLSAEATRMVIAMGLEEIVCGW